MVLGIINQRDERCEIRRLERELDDFSTPIEPNGERSRHRADRRRDLARRNRRPFRFIILRSSPAGEASERRALVPVRLRTTRPTRSRLPRSRASYGVLHKAGVTQPRGSPVRRHASPQTRRSHTRQLAKPGPYTACRQRRTTPHPTPPTIRDKRSFQQDAGLLVVADHTRTDSAYRKLGSPLVGRGTHVARALLAGTSPRQYHSERLRPFSVVSADAQVAIRVDRATATISAIAPYPPHRSYCSGCGGA